MSRSVHALVWIAGGRDTLARGLERARGRAPSVALTLVVFYLILVALAFVEEGAWDRLVWHEHAGLFGASTIELDAFMTSLVVALLSVPQATHYLLDRWIWRVGPRNPKLAGQLRLG